MKGVVVPSLTWLSASEAALASQIMADWTAERAEDEASEVRRLARRLEKFARHAEATSAPGVPQAVVLDPARLVALVERMLTTAEHEHPGVEFDISLAPESAMLLPDDGEGIEREIDGRSGRIQCQAFCDRVVTGARGIPSWLVMVSPLFVPATYEGAVPTYFGDLRRDDFATEPVHRAGADHSRS